MCFFSGYEMKPVIPSLREKKRYLVFEIKSNTNFKQQDVEKVITEEILKFIGTLGYSKAGVIFLKDNYKNNKGILRIGHKHVDEIKMVLGLIKQIEKRSAKVNTIYVSGILNKAKKYLKEE